MKRIGYLRLVFLMVLLILVTGCGGGSKETEVDESGQSGAEVLASGDVEEIVEKNLEAAGLEDVEISDDGQTISFENDDQSATVGENQEWPKEMPTDVPKVNFGNIYGTGSAGSAYFVTVNVEDGELEKIEEYLNGFYDLGWSQSYYYEDDMFDEKTMVFINDGYYVQVFVGGGQVTITCDDVGNNPFAGMISPMDTYDDTEEGSMSSGESVLEMGDLSDESFDPPSRFPDFDYGMEVEADPTMYPDAVSVRMFIGVASDELVDYFIACHDEGFGLLIQGENDIMGTYEAVHSKTDRSLYFQYGFDMESLTIVEYGGE